MKVTDEMVDVALQTFTEHQSSNDLDAMRTALTAALAKAWRPVKDELPEIGRVVLVSYNSGFNDEPVLAFGARVDTDEGWLWGVQTGYSGGVSPDEDAEWNSIDADDEYKVTHWQPLTLPAPPATKEAGER